MKLKKKNPTREEREALGKYGDLPEGWELMWYKNEKTGERRLLYVDHESQTTSWTHPRKKK